MYFIEDLICDSCSFSLFLLTSGYTFFLTCFHNLSILSVGLLDILLIGDYLSISGPFKINGVPLRRVNQSYVIGTSTKVDISGVTVEKFDDKYFAKEVQRKKKKGEGEFFEADKEVSILDYSSMNISS